MNNYESEATPEGIWAILRETAAIQAKNSREIDKLRESGAEIHRMIKEGSQKIDKLRESQAEESQKIKELRESQAEESQKFKEIRESQAEERRQIDKMIDKLREESRVSREEVNQQIKETNRMLGGMGKSQGLFAEEYFMNSLDNCDKKLFGEEFDACQSQVNYHNKRTGKKTDFDILLFNGSAVALIETKYKAQRENIQEIIDRVPLFRERYSQYSSHRIYLGIAAMSFEDKVVDECLNNGIAVFKQVGDTLVAYDENLKVF